MCGINGFNWSDAALIERMNDATKHRGPDGTGIWCDQVSLGHNRLAIIDLSESAGQPMHSTDGKLVITYNGEIYNFEALKKELPEYQFRTKGDTEVILAAYQKWGKAAFEKLNGIFAFALWDTVAQELILVRDRAGIKPLYYFWDGKRFIFSSEIKALLEHDVPRVLDRDAFMHYLRVLYVPAPLTMFKNISKLEPGTMLTLKGASLHIEQYPRKLANEGSVSDEGLREVIDQAVERQLVSDRPIGIYLSGGFDSSIILDSISRNRSNINTFSVGFELETDAAKYNADQSIARKTAAHYGTQHHEVMLSSDGAAGLLEDAVYHLDEPIGNPTALPMMYLAGFTKPLATVVFGGDGGDELFGGYPRYQLSLLSSMYHAVPKPLRLVLSRVNSRFAKLDTDPGVDRFAQFLFQKDAAVRRILAIDLPFDTTRKFFKEKFFSTVQPDFETQFMNVDRASWLVDESLMRTDKMGMAHAIEARVPFLDNEVAAYASRISREQKLTLQESKRMLKRAFHGRLPEYLYKEPKRGWFSPAGLWLREGKFASQASEILSPSYCEASKDIFRWDEVRNMFEAHRSSREYHLTMLWAILVFQIWIKRYKVQL